MRKRTASRSLLHQMISVQYVRHLRKPESRLMEAQIAMIPQTYVELTDEQAIKDLNRTLDLLDEDDDVTDVWTNWDE